MVSGTDHKFFPEGLQLLHHQDMNNLVSNLFPLAVPVEPKLLFVQSSEEKKQKRQKAHAIHKSLQ